jgi:hypothetical protein
MDVLLSFEMLEALLDWTSQPLGRLIDPARSGILKIRVPYIYDGRNSAREFLSSNCTLGPGGEQFRGSFSF